MIEHGFHQARATLVTEWVDGQTLTRASPTLTRDERFEVGIQLAEALAHVHDRGILHRDIKPENMIVRRSLARLGGATRVRAVLLDFDTALTHFGEARAASGTLGWAAPEQLTDHAWWLDRRADVYSLGAVLTFVFSGRSRLDGDKSDAVFRQCLDPRAIEVQRGRTRTRHLAHGDGLAATGCSTDIVRRGHAPPTRDPQPRARRASAALAREQVHCVRSL